MALAVGFLLLDALVVMGIMGNCKDSIPSTESDY